MPRDLIISERISALRFLMVFGVVVVHTPPALKVYQLDGTLWTFLLSVFQNGIFRSGVPVLTMIAGYLLFSGNKDRDYPALLRKKAATLLVPFIVFNFGHIAAQMLLRWMSGHWVGDDLFAQDFGGWMDSLFGIRRFPQNEPLHFLREMMVLMLLVPLFGLLIRRTPVLGLVAISLFFLTDLDGHLINRSDMPVEFYLGGMAAVHKWDTRCLDKFAYPALAIFVAASVIVTLFRFTEGEIVWLRLLAPLTIWAAASRFVHTQAGTWCARLSKYSFFIFVVHAALMRMCWLFFRDVFPSVPVALFTALAPFMVTVLCIGLYEILNILIPVQLHWALGQRGEKPQPKPAPVVVDEPLTVDDDYEDVVVR